MNNRPADRPLRVLVLAGGPDEEHDVSLASGRTIEQGLRDAGHEVRVSDIGPDDLRALDQFLDWDGDVIFPALHGPWGEGGGLQHILDQRNLPYVGSSAAAAELAMDKQLSKLVFADHGVPTPEHQLIRAGERTSMDPPVVVKPHNQGSSIGVSICLDEQTMLQACAQLAGRCTSLLVERYVTGVELTVGVLAHPDEPGGYQTLPPIQISTESTFYDYNAKYHSDQTRYRFDIDLPAELLDAVQDLAVLAHRRLGCRHLSRVDFIVDHQLQPWCLEVNTLPGFTSHSLFPMAAAHMGVSLPTLVDRLARMPLAIG